METYVDVSGTRESLINTLTEAQNTLQNEDTCELVIRGEGNSPDLRLNFRREDQPLENHGDSPWISRFEA